jgi:hypothetical protein
VLFTHENVLLEYSGFEIAIRFDGVDEGEKIAYWHTKINPLY